MKKRSASLISLIVTIILSSILSSACGPAGEPSQEVDENQEPNALTVEVRLDNIRDDLKVVKAEMSKVGSYNCCVQPGCDWCVLHEGECQCHDNLVAGNEVCPDCGLGWHNGKGVVQGVDAREVKWNITHEHPDNSHKH